MSATKADPRTGRVLARALFVAMFALGCAKKNAAPTKADAAPPPSSCLRATNARAFKWRSAPPLEVAVDVELDGTCKWIDPDAIELVDIDLGAKLGDAKPNQRYRLEPGGVWAEWDDPFLAAETHIHALFVYALSSPAAAVALRYGGAPLTSNIPVLENAPAPPLVPTLRIEAVASTPAKDDTTVHLVLLSLDRFPRSAGRAWELPHGRFDRQLKIRVGASATDDGGYEIPPEAVLDVDEKLAPVETPLRAISPRPARRYLLARLRASRAPSVVRARIKTSEGEFYGPRVEPPAALVVPKETLARLESAPRAGIEIKPDLTADSGAGR